ncbi:MAG: hypothetical protein WDM81_21650 [Rhizomicrobium sp.]
MRLPALLAAGAVIFLSACANDVGVAGGGDYFDGYYDGYYGPFDDGYWGTDGFYYYSDGHDHSWHRDSGNHFRHAPAGGFNHVHGSGRPAGVGMINHPGGGGGGRR